MKKTICLPICLLVIAVTARTQSPQPSWKTYVMKEADLSFTLPMFPAALITEFHAQGALVDDARLTRFFSSIALKKIAANRHSPAAAANSADSGDKPYLLPKDVDTKVEIKLRPDVTYTSEAENLRITGTVILRCIFTSKGTVTNIQVVKGLPNGLTEKAIEAAKQIKFIPATKDGKPVSMWMQLEYNFNMNDIR